MNDTGRLKIFTDELHIDESNILSVLQQAYVTHEINRARIDYLLKYEAGEQTLRREKTVRPEINILNTDNIANEITDFKRGYFWGNPITLVQRGNKDSGNETEQDAIALLNECYDAEGITAKTQELGRFIEICGIGYTYVDYKPNYEDGDSYFQIEVLDPRYAFVVRSNRYVDKRVVLGVSFSQDTNGTRHYTAITDDKRFEIDELVVFTNTGKVKMKDGKEVRDWKIKTYTQNGEQFIYRNRLGKINIIEWQRDPDRMGCFERQIPEMDAINIFLSNISNEQEEETECIWHANDVEFEEILDEDGKPTGQYKKPANNDWITTETTENGKTPFIKPLINSHDYNSQREQVLSRRALVLQKCNVPQRNDNSGGSTGIAMSDATGWSSAETDACKEAMTIAPSKLEEVDIALRVIKTSELVSSDNPLRALRRNDVKVNMKRSKTYEMTTKINTYATGVSHGISPAHMMTTINLFDDPAQVISDSEPYIQMYLESQYNKGEQTKDRLEADNSDQEVNSPMLTGTMSNDY